MKSKQKVVAIRPDKPVQAAAPLPPPLVAAMFAEAGVALRAGRPETISATLGPVLARFRAIARRLPFEREPGLFPPAAAPATVRNKQRKKGGRR
jgi:hypothetical protein